MTILAAAIGEDGLWIGSSPIMKNPIQPIVVDDRGILRFKENRVVRSMLDKLVSLGYDLNRIHAEFDASEDDWHQFNQLIGYSLGNAPVNEGIYSVAAAMHERGITEEQARIAHLEEVLRLARDGMRKGVAALYDRSPDDFVVDELW